MNNIAFYISDHGFGHASRNIPIIRYILEANTDIKIMIKTGKHQGEFIKESLMEFSNRINYYFESIDAGLVLEDGSLNIDKDKLKENVQNYIDSFEARILKEKEFLIKNKVKLVTSDIVPWIFKCSNELNIKSILISNFTWVDIYKEYLDESICDVYRKYYALASKTLLYDLYMDDMKQYIKNYEEISLCCRTFNKDKVQEIKKNFKRKIVFISVGRSVDLNDEIDVSSLNYDFIATEGIRLIGDNVHYLPKKIPNTQDYIMVSDYIITKAGWSTVSESILSRKKIAVLARETVAEDRNTINKLKNMNLAIELNYKNGLNIKSILCELDKFNPLFNEYNFENDYKKVGKKILSYIREI